MRLANLLVAGAVLLASAVAAAPTGSNPPPRVDLNFPASEYLESIYDLSAYTEDKKARIKQRWRELVTEAEGLLTKWHPDGRLKSNARTMWRRKVREAFEEEWGKVKRIKIKPSDVEPYDPQNRVFKAGEHTFKRHSIGPDWIAPTKAPRKDTLLDTRVPGNEGIENAQRMLVRKRAHLALLEKRLCDAQNQEVVQECEETKPTLEREIKEWEKELEELLRRHKQAPKDAADPPSQFSVNSPFSASRFSDSLNTLKPSSLVIDGAGTLAKGGVIVGGLEGARRLLQGVTSWGNIGKVLEF